MKVPPESPSMSDKLSRYARPTQWLHWLTAALFIAIFAVAFYMDELPLGPEKFQAYNLHKSLGFVILVLAVLRLVTRLIFPAPPALPSLSPLNVILAKLGHLGLYGLMIIMPVIGIFHSWFANFPIVIFNQFTLPSPIQPNSQFVEILGETHEILGLLFLAMIIGHIGIALFHHIILKDKLLVQMNPFK